jgi:hypothetical protein
VVGIPFRVLRVLFRLPGKDKVESAYRAVAREAGRGTRRMQPA